MDSAKRDIEELKEMLTNLMFVVSELNTSVKDLIESK
jgi:hypothetical protein